MNLREFQYVIAIAEEESISKAARRLHIAQPSLSLYIQRLEHRLGTQLFDRSGVPVKLTHAGNIYLEKARKILAVEKELYQELQDMSDMRKGSLSIGLTVYWGLRFLPKVLPIFHSLYPGVEISIREGNAQEIRDWALHNQTDLTVMTVCDLNEYEEELEYEALHKDQAYVVLSHQHRLLKSFEEGERESFSKPWVDFSHLKNEPFILQVQGCTLRHIASHLFKHYNFVPRISHEVQNGETAEALATAGIGVAFSLEDNSRFHDPDTRPEYFSVGLPPVTWTLCIVREKKKYLTQAARSFIEVSRSAYT